MTQNNLPQNNAPVQALSQGSNGGQSFLNMLSSIQQQQHPTQQHPTQQHPTQQLPIQVGDEKNKVKNIVKSSGEKEKELREMLQKKKQDLLSSLEERDRMLSRIDDNNKINTDNIMVNKEGIVNKISNASNDNNNSSNNTNTNTNTNANDDVNDHEEGEDDDDDDIYFDHIDSKNHDYYQNKTNQRGADAYERLDREAEEGEDDEEEEVDEEDEDDHSLNVSHTSDINVSNTSHTTLNQSSSSTSSTFFSSPVPVPLPAPVTLLLPSTFPSSSLSSSIISSHSRPPTTSFPQSEQPHTQHIPSLPLPRNAAVPYTQTSSFSFPSSSSFPLSSSSSTPSSSYFPLPSSSSIPSSSSFPLPSSSSSSSSSKGTCESMCPFEERIQRIEESDVHKLEYPSSA